MQASIVGLIALLQGLLFLWLLPPWQHYDEPTHFEYAWLIANHGHLPAANEFDRPMQRAVINSMLSHNFYWNLPKPNLQDEQAKLSLGLSELDHPPVYYMLVSLPLRLVRQRDVTTQLYIARLVSLALFLLTVTAAGGITRNLTSPRSGLRWAVPLAIALFPALSDIMTAVNNDAGAICLFTCFLWLGVRTIRCGLTMDRTLGLVALAVLAPFVKNTAALALLLLPLVLLLALWVQRGWQWRYMALLGASTSACLVVAVFGWGDAAFWYRWPSGEFQSAATRVQPLGDQARSALMVETRQHAPTRYLLNPIPSANVAQLAGQMITVGGWVWADQPITASVPALMFSPRGTKELRFQTHPISVTTTPTFHSWTTQLSPVTGTLYYTLIANIDQPVMTRLYLRNPILVPGSFGAATEPTLVGKTGEQVLWAGHQVPNMVRNATLTMAWPRLRPWLEGLLSRSLRRSPAQLLDALLDVGQSGRFMLVTVAPFALRGVWSRLAWGQVTIRGPLWPLLMLVVTLVSLLGTLIWLLRRRWGKQRSLDAAFLFLAVAAGGVWILTLGWSLPYRWAQPTLPAARYALPASVPLLMLLIGGWQYLFPQQYRLLAIRLFVAGLATLDLTAIWTIWHFYQTLPLPT